jgi:hypothetical protein
MKAQRSVIAGSLGYKSFMSTLTARITDFKRVRDELLVVVARQPPHADVLIRAAQYICMSTDHHEYSPVFQRQAIAAYRGGHHIRIVRDDEDAGISGVTLRERPARSYSCFGCR